MRKVLILILIGWSSPIFSQFNMTRECSILPGINVELEDFINPFNLYVFDAPFGSANIESGTFIQYFDEEGRAVVQATLTDVNDPNAGWELELVLTSGMTWNQWSTQGFPTSFNDDSGLVTDEYLEWIYYLTECGTLTGTGNFEGSLFHLDHSPSNNFFAFEVGDGASGVSLDYGARTWLNAAGVYVDSQLNDPITVDSFQLTFRFDIGECESNDDEYGIDIYTLGDLTIPFCDFSAIETLELSGIQQTFDNSINVFQTAGCSATINFPIDDNISVQNLEVGYNEFLITYTDKCGNVDEHTFSLTLVECDEDDICESFTAGEDIEFADCGSLDVTLNAHINCSLEGSWEVLNETGTLSDINDPNAVFEAFSIGPHSLVWSATCNENLLTDTIDVIIFVEDLIMPSVGEDQEFIFCEPFDFNLEGSTIALPYQPYWTQVSGPLVNIDNPNDPSTTFNLEQAGEYIFTWQYEDLCGTIHADSQSISVIDNLFTAGPDIDIFECENPLQVVLEADLNSELVGSWEVISGNGEIDEINNPNSIYVPNLGVNLLVWSSICDGVEFSDTVHVTLFSALNQTLSCGPDAELFLCSGITFELEGSEITPPYNPIWTQEAGPQVILSDINDPNASIQIVESGTYIFRWQYLNLCQDLISDTQTINVLSSEFTAGEDQTVYLCDGEYSLDFEPLTDLLNPTYSPEWTSDSDNEFFLEDPNEIFSSVTFNEPMTAEFTLEYTDVCEDILQESFTVTVNEAIEPSEECSELFLIELTEVPEDLLISSMEIPDQYHGTWLQTSGETILQFTEENNFETTVSNLDFGNYIIEWHIIDLECNYEFSCQQEIQITTPDILGCTLSSALNFDSSANLDDGSCLFDFTICDCSFNSHSPYELLNLGNGVPDDENLNFNCATWGYDCGDILNSPTEDPNSVCDGNLPPENGCVCEPQFLDLELGDNYAVIDSVYQDDELYIIETCYTNIYLYPQIEGNCSIDSLCYETQEELNCINLMDLDLVFHHGDTILYQTPNDNQIISFYFYAAGNASELSAIFVPECILSTPEFYSSFSVFPNPNSGEFIVQCARPDLINKLAIYDLSGKEIMVLNSDFHSKTAINWSEENISEGVYLLILDTEQGVFRKRLIFH